MSLRARLVLAFTYVLVLVIVALEVPLAINLSNRVDAEIKSEAHSATELLALLMSEAGSVISRERLIDEVWDTNWFGSTKTLDVHVSSLRRKLGDDSQNPRFIHTVRGVGFRFASAEEL